ncbi:helix-turn-helix transcriptional regulator [Candidatus Woesearchaeota archaeon]|nr:helix-turn-helix transcriptional regulator [Candidatus Woesearchaeota archaeon]
MDIESLFTSGKWEIIKELAKEKYSPIELAQKYNTTIGNICQQLRLLEAYGLITKEKVSNRDKGKPRALFSLTKDSLYLVSAMNDFAEKKLIEATDYHKIITRIWFIDNKEMHYYVEKLFWNLEPYLDQIDALAVSTNDDEINAMIITQKPGEMEKRIKIESIKKRSHAEKKVRINFLSAEGIKKKLNDDLFVQGLLNNYTVIHDPKELLSVMINVCN